MDRSPTELREDLAEVEASVERIAVLFTHGQGEQAPMEDVLELARTVWSETPEALAGGDMAERVWSTPIYDADMSEQRRLVSGRLVRPGRRSVQVDFYQFYWADLMIGNKFYHVWSWFLGLMRRKRSSVPEPLRPLRRIIMHAALAIGILGFIVGALMLPRLVVSEDPFSWPTFYALLMGAGVVAQVVFLLKARWRLWALITGVALVFGSVILGFGEMALVDGRARWVDTVAPGVLAVLAKTHSVGVSLLMLSLPPLSFGLWFLYKNFLVPVMADSARMFSDSPENVPCRDRIRKRGMELLEALHASDRRYDRIVVVAHSLGTAVAYNVISQYWGNVYRLLNHKKTAAERDAVEAAARALTEAGKHLPADPHKHPSADREEVKVRRRAFRQAVRAYFAALRAPGNRLPAGDPEWDTAEYASEGHLLRTLLRRRRAQDLAMDPDLDYRPPWLISDFITVGSPLTYGGFLLAHSDERLAEQFAMRRYPQCPPCQEGGGFTFRGKPHHAAPFAATCWTNLFFETDKAFWRGDIVGGPVAGPASEGRFGLGPLDCAIKRHPSMPAFAHCEYWKAGKDNAYLCTGKDPVLSEHVTAIRSALSLFGESWLDEPILEFLAPPRTDPQKLHDYVETLRAKAPPKPPMSPKPTSRRAPIADPV